MRLCCHRDISKRGRERIMTRVSLMQVSDRALTESIAEMWDFCVKAAVRKPPVGF